MQLTPIIAVHMTAALGALVTGPVALWARKGAKQRPRLHRAFGYAWVTLMIVTAVSAIFIRDTRLPNLSGFTPIHLLIPVTLLGLFGACTSAPASPPAPSPCCPAATSATCSGPSGSASSPQLPFPNQRKELP